MRDRQPAGRREPPKGVLFLRMLIDGLRMVRGHAKDSSSRPPIQKSYLSRTPRRLHDRRLAGGARDLKTDIEEHMNKVRQSYERQFGKL